MAEPASDGQLDRATDPEYAAVSTMAVFGAILGTLGIGVSVAVVCWEVPAPLVAASVLAIVVSALAMRKIRRSRGVLVGRKLALAGLLLGVATAALGGGYHGYLWLSEYRTLEELREQSFQTIDDALDGRYEKVFEKLTDDSPHRKWGQQLFRERIARLFEGAGNLVQRDLLALQMLSTKSGKVVAPADMRVQMERRILAVELWFRRAEDGQWQFVGLGGQETRESIERFGSENGVESVPPPYQRIHGHDHHHH